MKISLGELKRLIHEAKRSKPYRWIKLSDLKVGDVIDVYAGSDKGQERGSYLIRIEKITPASKDTFDQVMLNDMWGMLPDGDVLLITDPVKFGGRIYS